MKKIIVGISGGVDSSVVSYLLQKNKDYNVELLFMRNWDSSINNELSFENPDNVCPQEKDWQDACAVAKQLNLKIHREDFVEEYWNDVFLHFIEQYKQGRTPNPDIFCNKYIKFHQFLNCAVNKYGADYIAMGHYARVIWDETQKKYNLLRGIDPEKDQSYFLCQLNQAQLSKTLFPLGNMKKSEVRNIAKQQELATAEKRDSTGICFIGNRDFRKFLENYIPNLPGDIIDVTTQKVIGQHNGTMYYTIGQRKGLPINGMKEPYFLVGKNISEKILYAAPKSEENYLLTNKCSIVDVNWINNSPRADRVYQAKFRYRQKDIPVKIRINNDNDWWVECEKDVKAITPGQHAVIYDGEICLGGGIINEVFYNKQKRMF